MIKKRTDKNFKQGLGYHIKHKSRLTSLLIIKILLVFLCLGLGIIIYYFINDIFGQIISGVIGFAAASALYLFLVIKVLNALKF